MAETSPEILKERESCWPEILKRVPAKQLGVCRCVSKNWNSVISSSAFISSLTLFISQTQLQSSNLFLIRSLIDENPLKKGEEFYKICSDKPQSKTLETLEKNTIICPFKTSKGIQFRIVGSVNGVIFMSDDCCGNTYTFILWNPLVNCFIHLPKPRACFDAIGPYMHASGFGYDAVNDDFKVVRITYPQRRDGLDETPPRAELYSVKEGKWRWVSSKNVEYCTTDLEWTQCFLNERTHWIAYERWGEERDLSHKSTLLLLFNVVTEKFQMMKLPVELREACPMTLSVSECQGMLCVFQHEMTGGMMLGNLTQFNLWVKKEYNVGASWSKMVSVDLTGGSVHKVLYWRRNGELLGLSKEMNVVSYDPETKSVAVLAKCCAVYIDTWSFVESLAFLNEDCKNRRRIVPEEDENNSRDDEEERTFHDLQFVVSNLGWRQSEEEKYLRQNLNIHVVVLRRSMGKFASYMYQLRKYRRQF